VCSSCGACTVGVRLFRVFACAICAAASADVCESPAVVQRLYQRAEHCTSPCMISPIAVGGCPCAAARTASITCALLRTTNGCAASVYKSVECMLQCQACDTAFKLVVLWKHSGSTWFATVSDLIMHALGTASIRMCCAAVFYHTADINLPAGFHYTVDCQAVCAIRRLVLR
jgi:hypothetical protein